MLDALLYAVRDGIRAARINFDQATCEITEGPEPPPVCGNFFAAVHGGLARGNPGSNDNNLDELYEFSVTLTMRVTGAPDRTGDQQIYRNVVRDLARQQGFQAKSEQLRALLHMNWQMTVQANNSSTTGYTSANDNLATWVGSGTVYGFVEPMRWMSTEFPKVVGGEWFSAEPDAEDVGVKSTLQFGRCRRFQPHTLSVGPFV